MGQNIIIIIIMMMALAHAEDTNPVFDPCSDAKVQKSYGFTFAEGGTSFVCLNNTDCAVQHSKCKNNGGSIECDLGIQLAFSGTDKNDKVLNSWYEVVNLRQYSLYALYSDLNNSITGPFKGLF